MNCGSTNDFVDTLNAIDCLYDTYMIDTERQALSICMVDCLNKYFISSGCNLQLKILRIISDFCHNGTTITLDVT